MYLKQTENGTVLMVEILSANCEENVTQTSIAISTMELPTLLKISGPLLAAQAMAICDAVRDRVRVIALFHKAEQAYIVVYSCDPDQYQVGTYID